MTIPELFIQERKYLKNVSPATVKWYGDAFKTFTGIGLEQPAGQPPAVLAARLKDRVIELQISGRCKPITVNSRLRVINAYLRWCAEEGYLTNRVKLPKLKEPEVLIEPWPAEEVEKLVKYRARNSAKRRVQTMALLIADTGLRISEVLALKREDIDLGGLLITVHRGKGGKDRAVPISFVGRKFLVRWLAGHDNDLVFCTRQGAPLTKRNIFRSFRLLCDELGIAGVRRNWHCLRHSFAAAYIREGGDPLSLQRLLGHSTLEMTKRYVRLNNADLIEKHTRHARLLAGARAI
jgi:integrase/recombinase XerD